MITVNYVNGFCKGVDLEDLRSLKQVGNSIIMANSIGFPFRGKPHEMAQDAVSHVYGDFVPIVIESWGGCDKRGDYTTKVVFQAVCPTF